MTPKAADATYKIWVVDITCQHAFSLNETERILKSDWLMKEIGC